MQNMYIMKKCGRTLITFFCIKWNVLRRKSNKYMGNMYKMKTLWSNSHNIFLHQMESFYVECLTRVCKLCTKWKNCGWTLLPFFASNGRFLRGMSNKSMQIMYKMKELWMNSSSVFCIKWKVFTWNV